MKNIFQYLLVLVTIIAFNSCFKLDNYSAPDITLRGKIIDSVTGEPIQTEQGNGIRIRLDELSWSKNPVPLYFWVKQDGTFNNTKMFPGTYRITPVDGPFVPLIQYNSNGDTVVDRSKVVTIKGNTEVNFIVEPFLEVKWMKDPVVNPDNSVTVNITFTRGTDNALYQFNVTDVYLFVSTTPYIGNSNYDSRYSTQVSFSGTDGNALLGQPLTISSKVLPAGRSYYIRVGARTADNVQKRYNYTDVKQVSIP